MLFYLSKVQIHIYTLAQSCIEDGTTFCDSRKHSCISFPSALTAGITILLLILLKYITGDCFSLKNYACQNIFGTRIFFFSLVMLWCISTFKKRINLALHSPQMVIRFVLTFCSCSSFSIDERTAFKEGGSKAGPCHGTLCGLCVWGVVFHHFCSVFLYIFVHITISAP